MKCYLLLRNNVETGPFTFEEITAQALKPSDLIWVEGQSVAWKYPAEIEALQPFVTEESHSVKPGTGNSNGITTSKGIFVALPPQQAQPVYTKEPIDTEPAALQTRFSQPLEALKENYRNPKTQTPFSFSKTFSKPHSGLWIGCVFAGLLCVAGIIKKIIETYNENTGTAVTAALPVTDMENLKSSSETLYQNALTTEMVPVDTVTSKPVKKAPAKVNLKKLVHLEANDYQTGLFGGIKNLRLLVTNKSYFVLDNVKIELNYLKPNGEVVKTENLIVKAVAPKSSKSLKVSTHNRGVKITYHITGIQSRQNAESLVSL